MDRVVGYVESVLILLTWCLLQQVFYANREFTSLEKIHFLLFGAPFVPLVAFVLPKELILHLLSTTCSSLLCRHDVYGPCTCFACGEELPLPAVVPQEVAFQGPRAAVEKHNTVGRRAAGVRAALTPFCGLAATCMFIWDFPKSLKHKRVVKTFLPFYVLSFFPPLLFLWAGT